jgi:DHA2 family multidrug resistance protein
MALFQMGGFNLDIDYRTAVLARMFQCFALPFLFIPSNTIAMAYLPREKSNSGTALINLSRNLGGSVGIAVVTTLLARRAQVHQAMLVSHLTPYDWQYQAALRGVSQMLMTQGASAVQALSQAQGMLYGMLVRQATMLAFVDNFRILGMASLSVIPLVFLIKKVQPGQRAGMGH